MTLRQTLESTIVGAHTPNIILLEDVSEYVDITYTLFANNVERVFNFKYAAHEGMVRVDTLEITKSIYLNYIDPFDYTATKEYTRFDNYNIGKLDIVITDAASSVISITDIHLINGALQVNECFTMAQYCGKRLGHIEPEPEEDILLNFDLNETIQ